MSTPPPRRAATSRVSNAHSANPGVPGSRLPGAPVPGSTAARRAALRKQAEAERQAARTQGRVSAAEGAARRRESKPVTGPSATDRYGTDVLQVNPHRVGPGAIRPESVEVPIRRGLVVEDRATGFVGAIVAAEKSGGRYVVVLEDRHGNRRGFPLGAGYWIDGRPVILTPPVPQPKQGGPQTPGGRKLTASGSYAVEGKRAKVARASRIWVEGKHDAELVEKVWGDDLRHEGVVVLMLDGIDNLEEILREFRPMPHARAGVLVDHLVPGSKESRIAERVRQMPGGENVLILGHPYVDVWQAVKPERVGLRAWPEIPRGIDIKHGTLEALGWPHADQADVARGWQRILSQVHSYKDLEPSLLARMEELIDFVTAPGTR